jgi:oxalate decarboxylase
MSDPALPSFRYRLEQQPPSQGIAGASMRLQPGCLRELHWHATAAELGYVVSSVTRARSKPSQ